MSHSEITLETTVVASQEQVSCDVGDETVVLNLKDGIYYGLNPVAASVWKSIQEEKRVQEIRDILVHEYEVEPQNCTEDILTLLSQLQTWRLVEIRNGSRHPSEASEKL
jgi:hypothetical protein